MGHITERPSKNKGKRWQATYRGPDGRERTETFDRKIDAQKWITQEEAKIPRGEWVDPRAGNVLLDDYATEWMAGRFNLKPSSRVYYQRLLKLHILPRFGSVPLGRLETSKIRSWHAQLHAERSTTAAGAYRLLRTICNTAVEDRILSRNPCRIPGAGVDRAEERPVASIPEVARAVAKTPERFQLAILLAAWCQLRRGEILGLQRADVNPLQGTVTVRRAWTTSGEGPPKTAAGWRTVTMPPDVAKAMDEHLKRRVGPAKDAWLFVGPGGNPISPRTLNQVWITARKSAGLPALRLHDLRHSGLTWLAATGATMAELMHRGGHASPATAMRYQHATKDRDSSLAAALGKLAEEAGGHSADTPATVDAE